MSADACPVCGCATKSAVSGFTCGGETTWSDCENATDLAISRAAEIERLKAMLAPKWTDCRAEELESLNALLAACMDIDRANNTLARLAKIIQLSEGLSTHSVQEPRPSLIEFLNQLCRDDRRNQSNQDPNP